MIFGAARDRNIVNVLSESEAEDEEPAHDSAVMQLTKLTTGIMKKKGVVRKEVPERHLFPFLLLWLASYHCLDKAASHLLQQSMVKKPICRQERR